MTIITHVLLTAAGAQLLHLDQTNTLYAYFFGVALDLDHLIKMPLYTKKYGLTRAKHYPWRTPLQEPVSLLWIIPLSMFLGTAVPVIFFIGHLLLDYTVSYVKRPFFPFVDYQTRGFFTKVINTKQDKLLEVFVATLLICLNLILALTKK